MRRFRWWKRLSSGDFHVSSAGRIYQNPITYHRSKGVVRIEWYQLLHGPNLSEETWRDALQNVLPASGLMGVVGCFAPPESETLDQSALEQIAETTDVILVSAFDRDATLIWTRGETL